jgi:type II secretory pathway predicted ATPase ExeA
MTSLKKGPTSGGFIISEGGDWISRDEVEVIPDEGDEYLPGTVLGKLTSGGAYKRLTPSANDGSQTAAAIVIYPVRTAGKYTVISRIAEVSEGALVWPQGATETQISAALKKLKTLHIIPR